MSRREGAAPLSISPRNKRAPGSGSPALFLGVLVASLRVLLVIAGSLPTRASHVCFADWNLTLSNCYFGRIGHFANAL